MHWDKDLAFLITPKSGPMRAMKTLLDANRAVSYDLPTGWLRRMHWRRAGWRLIEAADSGAPADIRMATELLVEALDHEGWMSRVVNEPWSGVRLAQFH